MFKINDNSCIITPNSKTNTTKVVHSLSKFQLVKTIVQPQAPLPMPFLFSPFSSLHILPLLIVFIYLLFSLYILHKQRILLSFLN